MPNKHVSRDYVQYVLKSHRDTCTRSQIQIVQMMASNITGMLSIRIHSGKGFSRCDPYVKIMIDGRMVSQTVVADKGQSATWNNTLACSLEGKENSIQFQLYDHDRFTSDDKEGQTPTLPITEFVRLFEGKGPQWVNMENDKGQLRIELLSVVRRS